MARAASALLALLALAAAAAAAAESPEWAVYRANVKAMTAPGIKEGTVGDALGPLLDYQFDLPLEFYRKAMSYVGPNPRLRRVVAQMIAGERVEVAVLGGSISAGAVASRKMADTDPNDVWSLVRLTLQADLSPKIDFYNNARAATKSWITSVCIDKFLNSTADLVFVEFIANDGTEMDTQLQGPLEKTRSFERFLRKIHRQPSDPAVVMMQMLVNEMAYPPQGMLGKPKRSYFATPEDTYANLAQYYGVPSLSFRDALWQLGDNGRDGMNWGDFLGDDRLHPNDRGHQLMADMVVFLMQQTAVDLLIHPLSTAELAASKAPLPPPMFTDNEAGDEQVCAQGKNLTQYIADSDGWELVAFDKGTRFPTYGYETTTPGKPLVIEVDTTTPNPARGAGVILTYTKQQSGIGQAQVTCTNGCECEPTTLDGAVPYDQIVLFLRQVFPTPAPACHINVELDPGSPAGSKLRISGVSVTADAGDLSGRVGEEKYMSWLSGEAWAA